MILDDLDIMVCSSFVDKYATDIGNKINMDPRLKHLKIRLTKDAG